MKTIRVIISVLLLPLLAVLIYKFINLFVVFAGQTNMKIAPFWIGVITYFLFQIIFFKPMSSYVFGHELTHAIAGLLSGAEIKSFKVSQSKGSVSLTKDNIFITLSPYFIPLYAVILIIIYFSLAWFVNIKLFYPYFLFLSGMALAFHYALTFYAIKTGQEDIKVYGSFFSLVFICFVNIIIVIFVLVLIFPDSINIKKFYVDVFENAVHLYKYIFAGVYQWLCSLKMK
ncbi:MAG: hypothetical protein VB017_02990 [Endomicrobiaceae bacterium]|jgi:hypothetical protein|nr:hypothetical protein [Endomicrobiaceae bacterium]